MKPVTIWQRINTAFWLLIVLLLAGCGRAVWVTSARSASPHRSDQLSAAKDRIAYDVVLISDTVRGLLLDPKNEPEKRRKHEAEAELASRLTFIQREYSQYPELMRSVGNLLEFTSPTLNQFHDQVLASAESDPAGAGWPDAHHHHSPRDPDRGLGPFQHDYPAAESFGRGARTHAPGRLYRTPAGAEAR